MGGRRRKEKGEKKALQWDKEDNKSTKKRVVSTTTGKRAALDGSKPSSDSGILVVNKYLRRYIFIVKKIRKLLIFNQFF